MYVNARRYAVTVVCKSGGPLRVIPCRLRLRLARGDTAHRACPERFVASRCLCTRTVEVRNREGTAWEWTRNHAVW